MGCGRNEYHIIYKATTPSNKIYIGYTNYTLKVRKQLHYSDVRKGTKRPFINALRKYEVKEIKWEIIATYQTKEYALNREKYFIKRFNCKNSEIGYNITDGGEGSGGYIRQSQRKQIIDKDGVIYNGMIDAQEKTGISRTTISNSIRNNHWCKGNYFSIYKKGMTKAEKPRAKQARGRRKIINNTTGEIFNSIREACEYYKTQEQQIQRVLKGRRQSWHGNKFSYLEDK